METVQRPWGNYTTILEEDFFKVKRIVVYRDNRLSLQFHFHRSEHWVIVSGQGIVHIGDDMQVLNKNQSIYIPCGVKHRITNTGLENLVLIETQIGSYLGEDDIVRLEDDYGRV